MRPLPPIPFPHCARSCNSTIRVLGVLLILAGFGGASHCDVESTEITSGQRASALIQVHRVEDFHKIADSETANATAASEIIPPPLIKHGADLEDGILDLEQQGQSSLHESALQPLMEQESGHFAAPFRQADASEQFAGKESYDPDDPFPHAAASQSNVTEQLIPSPIKTLTLTSQWAANHHGQPFADQFWVLASDAQKSGLCMSINCLLLASVWLSKANGSEVSGPYQITRSVPYDGVDAIKSSLATYFIRVNGSIEQNYVVGDKLSFENPDKLSNSRAVSTLTEPHRGSLHDVVGPDGVILITLVREPQRSRFSKAQLKLIGIYPRILPATDGLSAAPEFLATGCAAKPTSGESHSAISNSCGGRGCFSALEQAIARSHRTALEHALNREAEWTAIMEDDVMATLDETTRWDQEFRRAWLQRPQGMKIARLNWCFGGAPEPLSSPSEPRQGAFFWVRTPKPGGCTTAYMVHKSIIPELLTEVFPSCCAVDCWLENNFFLKRDPRVPEKTRAQTILANLEVLGTPSYVINHTRSHWDRHHGVLMQEREWLPSTRHSHGRHPQDAAKQRY